MSAPPNMPVATENLPISSGTGGIDELLRFDPRFRSGGQVEETKGLEQGTTTLLVGPPGTGKSIICYQFLFCDLVQEKGKGENKSPKVLYVSFDRDHDQVERALKEHWAKFRGDATAELPKERFQYLAFRQSQVNFNMLSAQIRSAVRGDAPTRIAVDGLSEWLSACEPSDSNFLLEALHFSVKEASRGLSHKLTQFLAFETPDARRLTPRVLAIPADNILVLDKIGIHDASREMIYALKAAGQQIDPTVREVVFNENGVLQIEPGFDAYTGLLERQPRPATVVLQLFEENLPERKFHEWARDRLRRLRNLDFTSLRFFRSEIGRTLEEVESRRDLPPSALRILSVDEWWLDKRIKAKGRDSSKPIPRPLAELTDLWRADPDKKPMLAKWSDFWFVEVEQAMLQLREESPAERGVFAVPGYMDFGMFCVNSTLLAEVDPERFGKRQDKKSKLSETHSKSQSPGSTEWADLISQLPRAWWEADPKDSSSLCGQFKPLIEKAKGNTTEPKPPWLFAFDSSIPETTACAFFELAWSFGEPEDFLAKSKDAASLPACVDALVFLQTLVAEGLMPASPTLDDTEESLFSRHFYSTLTDLQTKERRRGSPKPSHARTLVPLPFFPVGRLNDRAFAAACNDAEARLKRLVEERLGIGPFDLSDAGRGRPTDGKVNRVATLVQKTKDVWKKLEDMRENKPREQNESHSTSTPTMDREDVQEVLAWHALRLQILVAHAHGKTLADVLAQGEKIWCLPPEAPENAIAGGAALTGYGCQGSWMYAVHRSSRSVRLARDLIQEMTSLAAAEERQRRGAGIPARKDFFRLHGRERVRFAENLTWRQLLRFGCARARRRHRVLPRGVDASSIYEALHQEILSCLNEADQDRIGGASRESIAKRACDRAMQLIERIVAKIHPPST